VTTEPTTEWPPLIAERLARIQALARQNRRTYAIQKSGKQKVESKNTDRHQPKPAKARKPYFYNPASRD
jgi:hypothetical protein